jgi:hypothetical protein
MLLRTRVAFVALAVAPLLFWLPKAPKTMPKEQHSSMLLIRDVAWFVLAGKTDKWCAPYGYKMRSQLGCGGADKWTVQPNGAFPMHWFWEGGTGDEPTSSRMVCFGSCCCLARSSWSCGG